MNEYISIYIKYSYIRMFILTHFSISLIEVVDEIILFLHHLSFFVLIVALFFPYWVRFGFTFKDLFVLLVQFGLVITTLLGECPHEQ